MPLIKLRAFFLFIQLAFQLLNSLISSVIGTELNA